jgi:hypothetical protein
MTRKVRTPRTIKVTARWRVVLLVKGKDSGNILSLFSIVLTALLHRTEGPSGDERDEGIDHLHYKGEGIAKAKVVIGGVTPVELQII